MVTLGEFIYYNREWWRGDLNWIELINNSSSSYVGLGSVNFVWRKCRRSRRLSLQDSLSLSLSRTRATTKKEGREEEKNPLSASFSLYIHYYTDFMTSTREFNLITIFCISFAFQFHSGQICISFAFQFHSDLICSLIRQVFLRLVSATYLATLYPIQCPFFFFSFFFLSLEVIVRLQFRSNYLSIWRLKRTLNWSFLLIGFWLTYSKDSIIYLLLIESDFVTNAFPFFVSFCFTTRC